MHTKAPIFFPAHAQMQSLNVTFLFHLLRRYRKSLSALVCLGVLANGVSLLFPVVLKSLTDAYANASLQKPQWSLLLMVAVLALCGFFIASWRDWLFTKLSARLEFDFSSEVVERLLTSTIPALRQRPDGEWLTVFHQVRDLKWFVGQAGCEALFDGLLVLGYFGLFCYYDLPTAWVYLALVLVVAVTMRRVGASIFTKINSAYPSQCAAEGRLMEALSHSTTIRTFLLSGWSKKRWQAPFGESVERMRQADFQSGFFGSVFDLIHRAAPVLFLAWKLPEVSRGEMAWGTLLALSSMLVIGFDPLVKLVFFATHFQKAARAVNSLKDFWDIEVESVTPQALLPASSRPQPVSLSLRDVSFRFPAASKDVLERLSIDISPGEYIGLAGPSGAGKSTLLSLLVRLNAPSSGTLLFNGLDICRLPISEVRKQAALVEQESNLFHAPVLENIALGDESPSRERAWECLELTDAADFISKLPEGIETVLDPAKLRLSTGQRQRIALARALYWNPKLLLLDEPTSALDGTSEKRIHDLLHKLRENRTIVVSAHRLHTLKQCDRIVVLSKGSIIEVGPHEKLIQNQGQYSKMWMAIGQ